MGPTPTGRLWGPAQVVWKSLDYRLQGSTFQTESCAGGLRRGPLGMKLEPKLEHPCYPDCGLRFLEASTGHNPFLSIHLLLPRLVGSPRSLEDAQAWLGDRDWASLKLGTRRDSGRKRLCLPRPCLDFYSHGLHFPEGPSVCVVSVRSWLDRVSWREFERKGLRHFEVASLTALGRIPSDWRERTPEK